MKLLITGAAGLLGEMLAEVLMNRYELRLSDVVIGKSTGQWIRSDVTVPMDMYRAIEGVDILVHLAAWHCLKEPPVSAEAMFNVNVKGTFNTFQACVEHGLRKILWVSTMHISGYRYHDTYAMTKVLGEAMCRHYHMEHDWQIAVPRPHTFTPCSFLEYGRRILTVGVDKRDVITALSATVDKLAEGRIKYEVLPIYREYPFTREEAENFSSRARQIIEKYWPGGWELVEKYQIKLPEKVELADISRTKQVLGWSPRYNFGTFLEELHRKDNTH